MRGQYSGSGQLVLTLFPSAAVSVDRIVVREDITRGQLVRGFTVTATLPGGATQVFATGPSIGNKYIAVLPDAGGVTVTQLTLNITSIVQLPPEGAPYIMDFSAYSCGALAREADEAWARSGY